MVGIKEVVRSWGGGVKGWWNQGKVGSRVVGSRRWWGLGVVGVRDW